MLDSTEELIFSHVIKFTVEENGFISFADVTFRVVRLSVGDGVKELESLVQLLEVIMQCVVRILSRLATVEFEDLSWR